MWGSGTSSRPAVPSDGVQSHLGLPLPSLQSFCRTKLIGASRSWHVLLALGQPGKFCSQKRVPWLLSLEFINWPATEGPHQARGRPKMG